MIIMIIINDSLFFFTHFTLVITILIIIAIPLTYLIIIIIIKIKKKEYIWFKGIKVKIIFYSSFSCSIIFKSIASLLDKDFNLLLYLSSTKI